jgi:hypothetical protein
MQALCKQTPRGRWPYPSVMSDRSRFNIIPIGSLHTGWALKVDGVLRRSSPRLLTEPTAAEMDNPEPGAVFAGRIEADHLGAPFRLGAMLTMLALAPGCPGVDRHPLHSRRWHGRCHCAHARRVADLWIVDQFVGDGIVHRRALSRRRWQPRAAIAIH